MPDPAATIILIVVLSTPRHDAPSRYHQDLLSPARCVAAKQSIEADMANWHYTGHVSCVTPAEIGD